MKNITRALALLLALILILGLVVTGFAEGAGAAGTGKITINNAVAGQTYTIYKILTLESFNAEAGKEAYSYKAATGWANFFKTGDGAAYFDVTDGTTNNVEAGYVTWKSIAGETEVKKEARVAAFAKKALEFAKNTANGITATSTEQANATTVEFNSLGLGYYLLDSSLGTLCSLDTTNSDVTIREKNEVPANEKKVQEDSKLGQPDEYGDVNDADIGQIVNFKSTIKAKAGAQKYVFHDTMSAGLTFNETSVTVTKGTETVANTYYTLKTKGNAEADKATNDECTFEIAFTQAFCDTLTATDTIVITYSATLNDQAVIAGEGNTNKSKLSYGDNSATEWSQTTTKTWKVSVFKFYQKDDTTKTPLAGAKFTLNRKNDGTEAINLIKLTGAGNENTYRVAATGETGASAEITTDTTGKFTIQGLDSDTYYLTETAAPKGYNKLKDPIAITIDNAGNVKLGQTTVENGEVQVENKTGAEMPSTGGIGTTVFYVVGGILAVGAAVLLVTKKRMERG